MAVGGRLGTAPLATGAFVIALLASGPVVAQANGDPGSALLGISRAQTHSEAKEKSNANPSGEPNNANTSTADPPKDGTRSAAITAHHN